MCLLHDYEKKKYLSRLVNYGYENDRNVVIIIKKCRACGKEKAFYYNAIGDKNRTRIDPDYARTMLKI